VEVEVKREQAFGRAVISAVASLQKGDAWRQYADSLKDVLKAVENDQLTARGVTKEDLRAMAADELVSLFSKMQGIKRG